MSVAKKHPVWQKLMDSVYDAAASDRDIERALAERPLRDQMAVALGNLNYQVENGGFGQWITNGCPVERVGDQKALDVVLAALKSVGTPNALRVHGWVKQIRDWVDMDAEYKGCMGDYWADGEVSEDDERDPHMDELEEWSDHYYTFNAELMDEIEEWLTDAPEPAVPEEPKPAPLPKISMVMPRQDEPAGNAFSILGSASAAMKRAGWTKEQIDAVMAEAQSGDYAHLRATIQKHIAW